MSDFLVLLTAGAAAAVVATMTIFGSLDPLVSVVSLGHVPLEVHQDFSAKFIRVGQ